MSLHNDELKLISRKLMFTPDYIRFRSVCKSWRSAVPKRPQLPLLITLDRTDSNRRFGFFRFFQFSFKTNNFIRFPELSEFSLSSLCSSLSSSHMNNEMDWIGTSHGWLALFNRSTTSVSIFNPLTNSSINLPRLKISSTAIKFYLTSDPGESLSDCFALVYINSSQKIRYCKIGCTDWIEMSHPYWYHTIHICCYHGNVFITTHGDVFVCNFGCEPSARKIFSSTQYYTTVNTIEDSYLVESDGDMLLVLHRIIDFQVLKVEFEGESVKLVVLESLGGKALFVSPQMIYSLTASMYLGCKDNSVYYTNAALDLYGFPSQKLNIYDLKKGSREIINNEIPLCEDRVLCDWFRPSLLM